MTLNSKLKYLFLINEILLISCLPVIGQIDGNYNKNIKNVYAASSVEECQSFLKFCNEVLNVVPHHPVINYLAARLNALIGNDDIALEYLKKATKLGYITEMRIFRFVPELHQLNDPAFINLREKEEFSEITRALELSEKPIHNSEIAFIVKDNKLEPEGITYDPIEKMFYLGSMRKNKIVKVDHSGKSVDFTYENQDGLNMVLGIHVDITRRVLWVCSYEKTRKEIFKYNLSSGKLIKKYLLSDNGTSHHFNDLVICDNGDVYITDPEGASIYVIPHDYDKLELFFQNKLLIGVNGITISEDSQSLFVGGNVGIFKIDIKAKSLAVLTHGPDLTSYADDGLYYSENNLYAVQLGLNQVSRFSLDKDGTKIENCEIFERNSPYLHNPTTGVIVDEYFYFLAGYNTTGVIVMKMRIK